MFVKEETVYLLLAEAAEEVHAILGRYLEARTAFPN